MNTQTNFKSKLFKAAWTILREKGCSMSEALTQAWVWAKKNLVEKFARIIRVAAETEKAVLAVVGQKYDHVREEMIDVTMWVPKSIIVCNAIPEWFYRKNK